MMAILFDTYCPECEELFAREFGFQFLCRPCWKKTIGKNKPPGYYKYLGGGGWALDYSLVQGSKASFNHSDFKMLTKAVKVTHPDNSNPKDLIEIHIWLRDKRREVKLSRDRAAWRKKQDAGKSYRMRRSSMYGRA